MIVFYDRTTHAVLRIATSYVEDFEHWMHENGDAQPEGFVKTTLPSDLQHDKVTVHRGDGCIVLRHKGDVLEPVPLIPRPVPPSESMDLEERRAAVIGAVNHAYAAAAARVNHMAPLYSVKVSLAQAHLNGAGAHPSLVEEALERNVSVDGLANMIKAKHMAALNETMTLDAERRNVIKAIKAASSIEEVKEIASTIEGAGVGLGI